MMCPQRRAPRHRAFPAAAFAALIAGPSPDAWAQDASAPVTLPPVMVTGEKLGSLAAPTAGEARERIERTPGAVEVVPDTVWRDTPSTTLKGSVRRGSTALVAFFHPTLVLRRKL